MIDPEKKSRQAGRTSKQMLSALPGAVFVWCNVHAEYARALARCLGRPDLVIVTPKVFFEGKGYLITTAPVLIDHAYRPTTLREEDCYLEAKKHLRAQGQLQ